MTNFVIENDVLEFSESIITRENIDKQLSHYATCRRAPAAPCSASPHAVQAYIGRAS